MYISELVRTAFLLTTDIDFQINDCSLEYYLRSVQSVLADNDYKEYYVDIIQFNNGDMIKCSALLSNDRAKAIRFVHYLAVNHVFPYNLTEIMEDIDIAAM
jgi:hypothetical protein